MYPGYSAKYAVAALSKDHSRVSTGNADLDFLMVSAEGRKVARGPWFLRLLPAAIRSRLTAMIAARQTERAMLQLWETSPHLLEDAGIVLTRNGDLPEHLIAAPQRVIDHVASVAPEQIVAAEMAYPAHRQVVVKPGKTRAARFSPVPRLVPVNQ